MSLEQVKKSKYDSIWSILSTNNIEIDGEVPMDLICIMCHKLAIDPYAALCGCQFCGRCIRNHLDSGNRYCPGDRDECCTDSLRLNINVMKDPKATRNMAKIIVHCPNKDCTLKIKLESLESHLFTCKMKSNFCPFKDIGCEDKDTKESVIMHLDAETLAHSYLLIQVINNLRNDLDEMKNMIEIRNKEIDNLKEDSKLKDTVISGMNLKIRGLTESNNILEQMNLQREAEMIVFKKEFITRETDIERLIENMDNVRRDVDILNHQDYNQSTRKHFGEEVKQILTDNDKLNKQMKNINITVDQLHYYKEKEFLWRIDNFSEKMKTEEKLRSAPFYRNSYKMHLFVSFHCGDLRILCHLMKGEFDNYLKWPLKRGVVLSILNHAGMKVHKSIYFQIDTFETKSAFNKPKNERNEGFGSNEFMKTKDITETAGLLYSDSLIVSLMMNDE